MDGCRDCVGNCSRAGTLTRRLWCCVRWYLSFKLSYRDLVSMMNERGIGVAHTTILRWVQRSTPEFVKWWQRYARIISGPWRMDETYCARSNAGWVSSTYQRRPTLNLPLRRSFSANSGAAHSFVDELPSPEKKHLGKIPQAEVIAQAA
jgi:transposase-like protein